MNIQGYSNSAIKRFLKKNSQNVSDQFLDQLKIKAPHLVHRCEKVQSLAEKLAKEFELPLDKVQATIDKFKDNEVSLMASLRAQRGVMLRKAGK